MTSLKPKQLNSSSNCSDVVNKLIAEENIIEEVKVSSVVVTGANAGIGKANAKSFAELGSNVILACRSLDKAEHAVDWIKKESKQDGLKLKTLKLDLSKLASVKAFAQEVIHEIKEKNIPPLRVLVLNAGMFPLNDVQTEDGLDLTFQVNHLGHFYLVRELLKENPKEIFYNGELRIVVVSSGGHKLFSATKKLTDEKEVLHKIFGIAQPGMKKFTHSFFPTYGSSKLCNVYFAQSLNDLSEPLLNGAKVTAVSIHPGFVKTEIVRDNKFYQVLWTNVLGLFAKNLDQGAATQFFASLAADSVIRNTYLENCKVESPSKLAQGQFGKDARDLLWRLSEDICSKFESKQVV